MISFPAQWRLIIIRLWLLNSLLIAAMPALNAHSGVNGVWETLCTLNGFKLVQVEGSDGDSQPASGSHCVFSYGVDLHTETLTPSSTHLPIVRVQAQTNQPSLYSYYYRFGSPPRAPPVFS